MTREEDNVSEEVWKLVGGLPGVVGLLVTGAALFWRVKFPQIGIEYLKAELDRNRAEIMIADQDRTRLRLALKEVQQDLADLKQSYMETLQEKERMAHELRQCRRQLKEERDEQR